MAGVGACDSCQTNPPVVMQSRMDNGETQALCAFCLAQQGKALYDALDMANVPEVDPEAPEDDPGAPDAEPGQDVPDAPPAEVEP